MNIKELQSKEAQLLKVKLKRSVLLCKAIYKYRDYVDEIKVYLSLGEPIGARELFEELEYPIQKLLMTAPLNGGPFTTAERATMRGLWSISVEDIENAGHHGSP